MSNWTAFALGALSTIVLVIVTVIAQDIYARWAVEAVRNARTKALVASYRRGRRR